MFIDLDSINASANRYKNQYSISARGSHHSSGQSIQPISAWLEFKLADSVVETNHSTET
jgi:hypothetical protein